jgi:arylamine N-acetyltransferase
MPSHLLSAPELEAALDRLHIPRESSLGGNWPHLAVDYATLLAVYYQFVITIPFENFNFHRNKPFVMHFSAIFNKLITRKEGGICYELHGMLALLLESLGFAVRMVPVLVNRNRDVDPVVTAFSKESTHVNTIVSFSDEKGCSRRFVCEMGVGTVSGPLALELESEQVASDGQRYRFRQVDEEWVFLELWQARTDLWVARYRVSVQDFDAHNEGTFNQYPFPEAFLSGLVGATQPETPHQTRLMVYKLRSGDPLWKALVPAPSVVTCSVLDGLYVETCRTRGEATTRTERRIETAQEYLELLWTGFGLKVEDSSFPLDLAVVLEKDKSVKSSTRFPVLTLENVKKAHAASEERPHESIIESSVVKHEVSLSDAVETLQGSEESSNTETLDETQNKRQKFEVQT